MASEQRLKALRTYVRARASRCPRARVVSRQPHLATLSETQVLGRLEKAPVADLNRSLDWALAVCGGLNAGSPSYDERGALRLSRNTKGGKCGYIFKTGDIAWLCRTCQADDTCVLCSSCFNDSDHEGHEVFFHRTRAGGICDCGDPEAWAPDGCCTRHGGRQQSAAALPPQVAAAVTAVASEVLRYIDRYRAAVESSFGPDAASDPEWTAVTGGGCGWSGEFVLTLHKKDDLCTDPVHALEEIGHRRAVAESLYVRCDKEGAPHVSRLPNQPSRPAEMATACSR